jgi:hypothetical protein
MKTPVKLEQEKYTIQVNYSQEAIDKKLMKFITKEHGDEFEISAEQLSSTLIGQVNTELLQATFVESQRVNVVEVTRQIRFRSDRDIAKGEEFRAEYRHPYPIEFAIIEEAYGIAKINKDVKVFELTGDYINEMQKKITPEQKNFVRKFYDFFKGLKLKPDAPEETANGST